MGDAYDIISSIMDCFLSVFNALFTTKFWCGFSWGEICVTFLVIDIIIGFILWMIGHPYQRHEAPPDTSYHGPDAKDQDGWYKGLYAKSGETYENRWD